MDNYIMYQRHFKIMESAVDNEVGEAITIEHGKNKPTWFLLTHSDDAHVSVFHHSGLRLCAMKSIWKISH